MTISRALRSGLPVPPGEYLSEVLSEKGLTQSELARRLGRPLQPVNEIVHGKKAITARTALQLERVLGVPAHIWTGLEAEYRIALARKSDPKLAGAKGRASSQAARPQAGVRVRRKS
jgi:HTH-type transcriptional regulator/antitoxin HigA